MANPLNAANTFVPGLFGGRGTSWAFVEIDDSASPFALDGDLTSVYANASVAAVTVDLPPAADVEGRVFAVKNTGDGTNAVTLDATTSGGIEGSPTLVLSAAGASVIFQSTGSTYEVLADK